MGESLNLCQEMHVTTFIFHLVLLPLGRTNALKQEEELVVESFLSTDKRILKVVDRFGNLLIKNLHCSCFRCWRIRQKYDRKTNEVSNI